MEINSYIMLTRMVPRRTYELTNEFSLTAVCPLPRIFEGSSFDVPHHSKAVVALKWQGDKHPQSYNFYRNLAVFHSFVSDDPETFQYATERAIKEVLPFLQLRNPVGSFETVDYDRFEVPIPRLSTDSIGYSPQDIDVPFENDTRTICYRDVLEFFGGLEHSEVPEKVRLHNMMFSYVFMHGLWDISNIGLMYKNEDLSVLTYMAILQQIASIRSGSNWRNTLVNKLNEWESGWGNKYADYILSLKPNRNRFAHGASYEDVSQKMWELYDKIYYSRQDFDNADRRKETELSDLKDKVEILERTVRKGLVRLFMFEYETWRSE